MHKLFTLIAVGFISALAPQAEAKLVPLQFEGTIFDSFDLTGSFGIVDSSGDAYVGKSFLAEFIFDTDRGELLSSPSLIQHNGGVDFRPGTVSPIVSATVTINGVSRTTLGRTLGTSTLQSSDFSAVSSTARDVLHNTASRLASEQLRARVEWRDVQSFMPQPIDYDGPYDITAEMLTATGRNWTSTLDFFAFDGDRNRAGTFTNFREQVNFRASFERVTIGELRPAGVAEPPAWAMGLLGFAALGFATRRQGRSAAR